MNQRGFVIAPWMIYLVIGLAVLGILGGIAHAIDSRGYQRGSLEVRKHWDAANRAAEKAQREREARVARELLLADKRAVAADQKADQAETKWKEQRRDAGPLAVCRPISKPAPTDSVGADVAASGSGLRPPAGPGDAGAPGVLVTPDFVRLHDGAWLKPSGEPLHRADTWNPGPAGAGIPVSEVLDVGAENARRCSADRRELATLKERIERAEAAYGK